MTRRKENWWRENGHRLVPSDITKLVDEAPQVLVIGTGASGLMRVSDAVVELCEKRGIRLVACPAAEAVKLYNEASEVAKTVAACFHLTC